jgi:hypothetical protein
MTDEAMSPLRRRMIEDMSMRRLASKTQKDYIQVIKNLAGSAWCVGTASSSRARAMLSAPSGLANRP